MYKLEAAPDSTRLKTFSCATSSHQLSWTFYML